MESHSTSKMIGAPPGYVGYDEAGQLTEKVRRNPYSIILFDEIEKAHKDVFNILLQILDDGRITDSQGRNINFSNTIIIMTSNAGSEINKSTIGFGDTNQQAKEKTLDALKKNFRPEFLNRIDEVIVFDSLSKKELSKIADIFINQTKEKLQEKNIKLEVSQALKNYIIKEGTNLEYGARPLRRTVQKIIEDFLTDKLIQGEIKNGDNLKMDYKNNKVVMSKK